MTVSDTKMKSARFAIEQLACDQSASKETTLEQLQELSEDLLMRIDALQSEIESDEGA
jgi:hypothetical protein